MIDSIWALYGLLQSVLQGTPRMASTVAHAGRVATVEIVGGISRTGEYGTSSDATVREIKALAADSNVACIELLVRSPGGKVQGTKDLADEVAAAAAIKPVYAYIQDIGASAAYWIASQATKVYSDPMAIVGGIGTYSVVQDLSGLANQLGTKVHVVKAGAFKGSGVPGTQITDEQLAEVQRTINALNQPFVDAVAKARKLSPERAQELADGRVHVGQEAVKLGLIDGVLSYDSFRSQLQTAFSQQPKSKGSHMFNQEKKTGPQSESFWSEVEAKIQSGLSRAKAITQTVAEEPDLHRAMLAEANG